jgi:DNA-binding NarL/FixJ family response regulator
MSHVSMQRIIVSAVARPAATVLLAALDPVLARILTLHLEQDFMVIVSEYPLVEMSIRSHSPSVMVFDTGSDPARVTLLRNMLRQFPLLPVITTSTTVDEAFLDTLMGLGIRGHINRRYSRPQDIAEFVKESLVIK